MLTETLDREGKKKNEEAISKILLGSYTSFQMLGASLFFAFLFLLVINIATGNIKKLKDYKPKDYPILVLIGLPGMFYFSVHCAAHSVLFHTALLQRLFKNSATRSVFR